MKKYQYIHGLSVEKLHEELLSYSQQLKDLKYKHAIAPLANSKEISNAKKMVARIHTELRARQIQNN